MLLYFWPHLLGLNLYLTTLLTYIRKVREGGLEDKGHDLEKLNTPTYVEGIDSSVVSHFLLCN